MSHPGNDELVDHMKDSLGESMKAKDISSEVWREYEYTDGYTIRLDPVTLFISDSGSHRVQTPDGVVHYIPPGWRRLSWLPGDPTNKPILF